MNYDHSFHAGNLADVFKHLALTLAIRSLQRKDKGFVYVDTHAGSGAYALAPGGEHAGGITLLWPKRRELPAVQPYFEALAAAGDDPVRHYPGSPLLAKALLRPQDRMALFETQPLVLQRLGENLGRAKGVQLSQQDGYHGLPAQIPPPEKRGLCLIDPPFEAKDEFQRLTRALAAAYRKWPQGIYLAWYPIKARGIIAAFHKHLREAGVPAAAVELLNRPEDKAERLNGSGLVVVNPPWLFFEQLLPALHQIAPLAADPRTGGRWAVRLEGWQAAADLGTM